MHVKFCCVRLADLLGRHAPHLQIVERPLVLPARDLRLCETHGLLKRCTALVGVIGHLEHRTLLAEHVHASHRRPPAW